MLSKETSMTFLIIKASRSYNGGDAGYAGPTWARAGQEPRSFEDQAEAEAVAVALTRLNPVGFDVVELIEIPYEGTIQLPCASGTRLVTYEDGQRTDEVIIDAGGNERQIFPLPAELQALIAKGQN